MQDALKSLEPQSLWQHFDQLLSIPHSSGHEEKVAKWLLDFAREHNFEAHQDKAGNVIMNVPATPGRENRPLLILQSHMDMVAVAAPNISHDFTTDPISVYEQDGFIRAKGTTLGADDGIGIATTLSIFEDRSLEHGPLKEIFTVEEETTMKGALSLSSEDLKGDFLLNLDSEDNGYLFVSCAGSCDADIDYDFERVTVEDCEALEISLTGFSGGHSGSDINKGHGNAILNMAHILSAVSDDCDFFLTDYRGGQARNSIPTECFATVCIPYGTSDKFKESFTTALEQVKNVYSRTDAAISVCFAKAQVKPALSYADTLGFIHMLAALPNGPSRMWDTDPDIVQTSCNTGVVCTTDTAIRVKLMPRSLSETALSLFLNTLTSLVSLLDNVQLQISNRHPCWSSPEDNALIRALNAGYRQVTGNDFKITAIHAGLECAQYTVANPQLQQASIGATVSNPHSPMERVDIQGVRDVYETVRRAIVAL